MGTVAPLTCVPRNSMGCQEPQITACVTHAEGDRVIPNTHSSKMSYLVNVVGENTLREE